MPARPDGIARAGARAAGCLLTLIFLGPPAAAAPGVTLKADAGLAGVTKPGRWTPIRVLVQSAASGLRGDLIVTWGSASLRRPIEIAAGATQQFEFYLQTMEVGSAVAVRLVSGGEEMAVATAPIRTLRADEAFAVCVAAYGAAQADCAAAPAAADLPRSPRGYDAADRVILDGGEAALTSAQRGALAQWRALRALEDSGSLAATDRPRSIMPALARKNRTGPPLRGGMALYVALLFGAAVLSSSRRFHAPVALGAIAAIVLGATAAALSAGQSGPRSAVIVHHATLVQQLPGAGGSIVTMQGALEYPAFDTFDVHALIGDAAFDAGVRSGVPSSAALDENGYPVIRGTFGLGDRLSFTLYGVSDAEPLSVVRQGAAVRVSNRSTDDLTGCRFGDGTAVNGDGLLRAGETALSADLPASSIGPAITCAMAAPPVPFTEARRPVRTAGRATLAAYLTPSGEAGR